MGKFRKTLLIAPLLFTIGALPVPAQHRRDRDNNFYNGVRQGGRGGDYAGRGNYDNRRNYDNRGHYDNRGNYNNNGYYDNGGHYHDDHGGIGPGKGALIGAGGGAVLGAIFGGGLKGTIIGGAAGAGVGALLGEAHQNNRDDNNYRR